MSLRLLLALAALAPLPGRAEAGLERVDLFHAGDGGYAFYRIPGMVVTAKGTVLAYCEARREGHNDWEDIDVLMRRSTDGGRTWGPPRKMGQVPGPHRKNPVALAGQYGEPDQVTYSNPVAIAARDGTIHFLFNLEFDRCFYRRSDDDGLTFSDPVEITSAFEPFRAVYDWGTIAAGPGHGIELRSGRLLVPFWSSTGKGKNGFSPSVVATVASDDGGRTWRTGEVALANAQAGEDPNCGEAVELADGRVMINARNQSAVHRRLIVIGPNGLTGWARPYFDPALLEPGCMGSILRLSERPRDRRNRLLFSNPDNLRSADGQEGPGQLRDRVNLTVKLSYDEGATWAVHRVIDPGPSAYSDLAVLPDRTILCLYERGGASAPHAHKTAFLTLARFNLEWLSDGKDSLK